MVTGPSTGGIDWRSRAMFLLGAPPNQAPLASFSSDCTDLDCDFDATGSADLDGTIDSYAWDFGDGATSDEQNPEHSYTDPGTYQVTLTVTDDDGDQGSVTHSVEAVAPNVGPDAAFTYDCVGLACSVDGRTSSDSDGTIESYGWTFDGAPGADQDQTTFTFDEAGTYDVTLTVTDDDGAQDDVTQQVTVAEVNQPIAFVAKNNAITNAAATSVAIPATAHAGDTALLFATHNVIDPGVGAPTGVSGWTLEETRTTTGMATTVWSKVLTGSDPGSTVTVTANRQVRTTLTAAVWSGADTTDPVTGVASNADISTTSHTTPTLQAASREWVVSYWSDKSSTTTAWTPPAGVQSRNTSVGTGAGRVTSLLADSGAIGPRGPVGGLTATTDAASTRGVNLTLTLAPPPPDQSPTAAFDSSLHQPALRLRRVRLGRPGRHDRHVRVGLR